jgi:hypothetical protein
VDRHARITVRQCQCSVPARLIGQRVRVLLRATEVLVFDGRRRVAHARATMRGSRVLVLDHYLEVLARKPGALPGATALVQARGAGSFTAAHEPWWAAATSYLRHAAGDCPLIYKGACRADHPAVRRPTAWRTGRMRIPARSAREMACVRRVGEHP